jgi:iron complex outermembrane recepter protein
VKVTGDNALPPANSRRPPPAGLGPVVLALIVLAASPAAAGSLEEIRVVGSRVAGDSLLPGPISRAGAADLGRINVVTSEDAVGLAPGVIVRRRYIGDANGVVGIRGSNMFQTPRSMVFADGLPLHYFLQVGFAGAPRWSLIAPEEIAAAEVTYGPFSAEHGGNAMGGVVNLRTRVPAGRRVHVTGSYFVQEPGALGHDGSLPGHRLFASVEDRIGDLGIFLSANRLRNDGQPQTRFQSVAVDVPAAARDASGPFETTDARGRPVVVYGDGGPEQAATDLYKVRADYALGDVRLRGTVAYEQREQRSTDARTLAMGADGPIWHGPVRIADTGIHLAGPQFEARRQDRRSLLIGAGLAAPIGDSGWDVDLYASRFDVLEDRERRTGRHPLDPDFAAAGAAFEGSLIRFDDTRWATLDARAETESLLGDPAMRLAVGASTADYRLGLSAFGYDAVSSRQGDLRSASGGRTGTQALYAQWGRGFRDRWDLTLGLRWEQWRARQGFVDAASHPQRNERGWSPKLSLAYFADDQTRVRYSLARAIRFPVAQELYQNVDRTTAVTTADASLEPERGVHHNLGFERRFQHGTLRLDLFHETIDDVIFDQAGMIGGVIVRTFLPIDRVRTRGMTFAADARDLFELPLDIRVDLTWTDAEVRRNRINPAVAGNRLPRLPEWRGSVLLGYRVTATVELSASLRFASNSFGDLDNADRIRRAFGAQDPYAFVGLRANWRPRHALRFSLGVDNLTNQEAYVFHPWPSRTLFFEGAWSL